MKRHLLASFVATFLLACLAVPNPSAAQDFYGDCALPADPETGEMIAVELGSGEVLKAKFAGCQGTAILLDHTVLGLLIVPRDGVMAMTAVAAYDAKQAAAQAKAEADAAAAAAAAVEAARVEAAPVPAAPVDLPDSPTVDATGLTTVVPAAPADSGPWDSFVEGGLNGSTGNSERVDFRVGIGTARITEEEELDMGASFVKANESGDTTEQKAFAHLRNDWLYPSSPWRWFGLGTLEHDKFKAYGARVGVSTGPAYEFINNERTTLVGRAGLGFNFEIGDSNSRQSPEALFGYDWHHLLREGQRLTSGLVVYPDLSKFGEFRAVLDAGWEIDVAPEPEVALRLGIQDRYESKPLGTGVERQDFDYFATLRWDF